MQQELVEATTRVSLGSEAEKASIMCPKPRTRQHDLLPLRHMQLRIVRRKEQDSLCRQAQQTGQGVANGCGGPRRSLVTASRTLSSGVVDVLLLMDCC